MLSEFVELILRCIYSISYKPDSKLIIIIIIVIIITMNIKICQDNPSVNETLLSMGFCKIKKRIIIKMK